MSKAMQLKAKIRNLASKSHVPAQAVLQNFMLERLLERVSVSKYKDAIVLKGGMLIASMVGISSRTTMDMDATMRGIPLTEEMIHQVFSDICAIELDDQTEFSVDHIDPIRADDEYGGYKVAIIARYETITTPLKIDITTGDALTPAAIRYAFQSSFENKTIEVWAYNTETILAEKAETIIRRGVFNTRARDFYDVFIILNTQQGMIDKGLFLSALNATVEKRGSQIALENKDDIIQAIQTDKAMKQRWMRYCKDNYYAAGIPFNKVISALIDILNY